MDTTEPNPQNDENGLQAPNALVEALQGSQKESVFIPPRFDEAVLKQARPHLAQIRRSRAQWNRAGWLALAASVVLTLWVAQTWFGRGHTYAAEDINHDGKVDILDAFQLAREIKSGKNVQSANDLNGDGRVDEADVAIIANRAVKLENGSPL